MCWHVEINNYKMYVVYVFEWSSINRKKAEQYRPFTVKSLLRDFTAICLDWIDAMHTKYRYQRRTALYNERILYGLPSIADRFIKVPASDKTHTYWQVYLAGVYTGLYLLSDVNHKLSYREIPLDYGNRIAVLNNLHNTCVLLFYLFIY